MLPTEAVKRLETNNGVERNANQQLTLRKARECAKLKLLDVGVVSSMKTTAAWYLQWEVPKRLLS